MFRRLFGAVCVLVVVVTGQVAAVPQAIASSVLLVPPDASAEVLVTASADPETYRYLQVKLTRPDLVALPYPAMSGIAVEPVANTGGAVEVTVPTWGLGGGTTATFVLLGCGTAAPDSCTSLLASVDRDITQTILPSATRYETGSPLLLPHDQLYVLARNTGGGRMTAAAYGNRIEIPVGQSVDVSEVLTNPSFDGQVDVGETALAVARCSTLTEDADFCEPPVEERYTKFLRKITPLNATSVIPQFTMNPEWSASSQTWETYTYTLDTSYTLTWDVRDPETGVVLLGPVAVPSGGTAPKRNATIDPGTHIDGLPDGHYDVVLTATVTAHNETLSNSSTTAIEVVNSPPADEPQVHQAERVIRSSTEAPLTARFTVDAYHPDAEAELVLRNSEGVDVTHAGVGLSVHCDDCPTNWIFSFDVRRYGDDNHLLDPGTYAARLQMRDSWGRPMTVPLGNVYIQASRHRVMRTDLAPRALRAPGTRLVGRCSTLTTPNPAGVTGSLWFQSLSRCGSMRNNDDVARQGLTVRLSRPPGDISLISAVTVLYRGAASKFGGATASCQLPGIAKASHTTNVTLRWRPICGLGSRTSWDPAWDTAKVQFRVARGARLDVRKIRVLVEYHEWYTPK